MFLTDSELLELTGYARNADRRRWLEKRGWKFEQAVNGRPAVLRSYAEAMLTGGQVKPKGPQLNLSVIRA